MHMEYPVLTSSFFFILCKKVKRQSSQSSCGHALYPVSKKYETSHISFNILVEKQKKHYAFLFDACSTKRNYVIYSFNVKTGVFTLSSSTNRNRNSIKVEILREYLVNQGQLFENIQEKLLTIIHDKKGLLSKIIPVSLKSYFD